MRIYISHSRAFDFRLELYAPVKAALGSEHQLILPHAESDEPFASRQLFEKGGCDIVLAETSFPSTGSGIELGWASSAGIPIYSIRRINTALSGSVTAVSTSVIEYTDFKDLELVVKTLIRGITHGSSRDFA